MAMSMGARRSGVSAEINMTPMIDVLLVLLIIFMVMQQEMRKGIDLHVPPPPEAQLPNAKPEQIMLEVFPGGRYRINRQPVGGEGLETAVARIYEGRPRKTIFVKGDERATYGEVVAATDAVRAAGVEIVGVVPRQ
jgi:biopolymer transport protein TolR